LALLPAVVIGVVSFTHQKELLYRQYATSTEKILKQFVKYAAVPLVTNDTLVLNELVKETTGLEGIIYVAVTDRMGIVQAHSDLEKIGTLFLPFKNVRYIEKQNLVSKAEYMTPSGVSIWDFSTPVQFKSINAGSAYMGFSKSLIDSKVLDQLNQSIKKMVFPSIAVIIMFFCVAAVLVKKIIRPVTQLKTGLNEIKRGNFGYRLKRYYEDELGELTSTFNEMSQKLKNNIYGKAMVGEPAIANMLDREVCEGINSDKSFIARSQATVLFAGVRGFKKYVDINGTEKALEDLNAFFKIASENILTFKGFVDRYIGDAIIGVFGDGPFEQSSAERAVRCAVEMQSVLKEMSKNGNKLLTKVGIGITSGVVMSGNVGCDSKVEYSFIGESFKMAYSLNVMAGPGEIVISKDVHRLIEDLVFIEPLPPREIMDKTGSWEIFRLLRILGNHNHHENHYENN
jgi:adenylate cyclase